MDLPAADKGRREAVPGLPRRPGPGHCGHSLTHRLGPVSDASPKRRAQTDTVNHVAERERHVALGRVAIAGHPPSLFPLPAAPVRPERQRLEEEPPPALVARLAE